MVFSISDSDGGPVLTALGRGTGAAAKASVRGSGGPGQTDDAGATVPLDVGDGDPAEDDVRARARLIAARLSLHRPPRGRGARRGAGELVSVRYREGADDIDLDRTLEVLAEKPFPDDDDIVVRERVRRRRSVELVVDVSGSMRGERIRTAAATVGALAGELAADDVGVIAFWSDCSILLPMGRPFRAQSLLDDLLKLPARGLTNVGFPLQLAAAELSRRPNPEARVLLLSDCVHNAGPDPRGPAALLPRLDVLLDASGEKDEELAREMAAAGRGRMFPIRDHRQVAPALSDIFRS
ncbi:VWA domain-containing protein [Kineosporia sp. J2-2]|uniref:VWA domain-containing protein n=1 Tax=Kineosporia corallincola TaxID=2835133 RepID=A0ABS5TQP7_9ACTN|nr:vWA domain-containing protein [Kineosporia corallincola]MBT0772498.1 VWA domain-containing protein [Kineosporia corallincola]